MTEEALHEQGHEGLEHHLKSRSTWMRLLYMVIFTIFLGVAELVLATVVVFQFLMRLITGEINKQLQEFGQSLSLYCYQIFKFLTFNSEKHPFPFANWPKDDGAEAGDR